MNEATTLVNGEPTGAVSVFDRGFQYGDGLFETIAVWQGVPLLWDRHMARLARGAERLGIAPPAPHVLTDEASRVCAQGSGRAVLKIILTRGLGARGYAIDDAAAPTRVVCLTPWPSYPGAWARDGVSLHVCATPISSNPHLAGIKHLNRLEQVLARAEWRNEHAEGIMCHGDHVIEGTRSNVFMVTDRILRTPDLSGCGVEGVMRAVVLEAADRLGIRCEVARLTLADLDQAGEIFITNSLIGAWPVRTLRARNYAVGPVTRTIQEAIRESHCFDRN
jgi:4-amino-4-deoxychorismate lyase